MHREIYVYFHSKIISFPQLFTKVIILRKLVRQNQARHFVHDTNVYLIRLITKQALT